MKPIFSILVPSIPSRMDSHLIKLIDELNRQCDGKDVEILILLDNKKRSVGYKRDDLVQLAAGEYLAFVDDDDAISPNYVDCILEALEEKPDIVTFDQISQINDGNPFKVSFSVDYDNEEAKQIDGRYIDIKRKPFHVCVWKSDIAKSERFADASYGEDWHWADRALKLVKNEIRIENVLHYYFYNDKVTEAALVFPEEKQL